MNVLTNDIISMITTRNFQIIGHNEYVEALSYTDQNGRFHRINGPAYICGNDSWSYYFHGLNNRADQEKPACKCGDCYSWYNMGEYVTYCKK